MRDKCLKPRIRFRGFSDEWEEHKFFELAKTRRGLTYKPSDISKDGIRVLRSSNINEDKFIYGKDDVFVRKDAINIEYVKENDILITSANGSTRLVGKHALIKELPRDTAVHGGFMILATANKNAEFLNASMSSNWYSKFIDLYVSGGNGAIGNLSKSDLDEQDIFIPSNEEQLKIGELFTNINNLITFYQRMGKKLVNVKKSLLEKMFPKNGKNVPEIRFKGFSDAWEQHGLNETYTFSQGMQVSIENQLFEKKEDMEQFIRIIDVTQTNEPPRYIYNKTGKGHVEPDDIFFVRYGAVGAVGYGYCGTIANNLFKLSTKEKFDNNFMYQQFSNGEFNKKLIEMSAATSMSAINFTALRNLNFLLANIQEQKKIGALFSKLDTLITLHQHKLEKLQNIKKSLLDKMFV